MDTSHKNILRKGRKIEDVWCCRQATTCIAFLEQYFGCVKKKSVSLPDFFWWEGGVCTQASVRQMIATIRGRPSLRSWPYSLGARLKFWRQSHDPKNGVRTRSFYFSRLTPPNLTRVLHNTASYVYAGQGRPCQPICSVCSKPGLPLASGWRTRVLKILSRITKDKNGREISNFGGTQCTIVASQASDTWPVSFCFKSFFKTKEKKWRSWRTDSL